LPRLLAARVAAVLCFTACFAFAATKTELGEINGAPFRIDVPDQWNGGLVLYCHGYAEAPVQYDRSAPSDIEQVFLDAGFAVAQSGYSATGWAIAEAVPDTQELARYFADKYRKPAQTYITGHSMGGFLTTLFVERFPSQFAGGLPLCGPLEPTLKLLKRVFDGQVVLQYFLPGALPPPLEVPASYADTKELKAELARKIEANPRARAALLRFSQLATVEDLAADLVFNDFIMRDIVARAGGNPFDNRSTIYVNTGDDNAVNAGVKRYAADPRAADYLRNYYTFTGHLARPLLAVHTTYDPIVPPDIPSGYATLAGLAGSADLFVQQYVNHDGHCAITADETAAAFRELRDWVDHGRVPQGGPVPPR
jgi:pimeloyl-ACP methyl ester carboxylesterase